MLMLRDESSTIMQEQIVLVSCRAARDAGVNLGPAKNLAVCGGSGAMKG